MGQINILRLNTKKNKKKPIIYNLFQQFAWTNGIEITCCYSDIGGNAGKFITEVFFR